MTNITLDKTTDGRYWTLTGQLADDWWIRLRLVHTTFMELSDVEAEVGVWCDGSGVVLWKALGPEFMFALGSPDHEIIEEVWTREFPGVARGSLLQLAEVLGTVSRYLDLGPALGNMVPATTGE
jgi:hypothetical protein